MSTIMTPMDDRISIVVCVRNAPSWAERCLTAICNHNAVHSEVVVVDDCSGPETTAVLQRFQLIDPRVRLIRPRDRQWFPRAANLGVSAVTSERVVLVNSDTEPSAAAIARLDEVLRANPAAMVGPLSNAAGFQSVPWNPEALGKFPVCDPPPGLSLRDLADAWMARETAQAVRVPYLNGFCVGFHKRGFDALGGFDSQAHPYGYGEETDLCLRHASAGGVLLVAIHAYVPHGKTQSYQESQRSRLIQHGRRALEQRHGPNLAASTERLRRNPQLIAARQRMQDLYNSWSEVKS